MICPQEHLDQHLKRRQPPRSCSSRSPHPPLFPSLCSSAPSAPHILTAYLGAPTSPPSLLPPPFLPSFFCFSSPTHTTHFCLVPSVLILTFRFPFQSRSSSEQPFLPSHCLSLSNLLICISPSLSWQPSSCPHTLLALDSGMALCASLPHTADSRPLPNSRLRLDWVPVPPPFLPSTSPPPLKHKGHIRRR